MGKVVGNRGEATTQAMQDDEKGSPPHTHPLHQPGDAKYNMIRLFSAPVKVGSSSALLLAILLSRPRCLKSILCARKRSFSVQASISE